MLLLTLCYVIVFSYCLVIILFCSYRFGLCVTIVQYLSLMHASFAQMHKHFMEKKKVLQWKFKNIHLGHQPPTWVEKWLIKILQFNMMMCVYIYTHG